MMKDPDAHLDYTWDFTAWLADGDEITSATITDTTGGITTDTPTINGPTVTVWITAGTPGGTARATLHITTLQGRTDDRTLTLRIDNR